MASAKNNSEDRSVLTIILCVFLFILTITLFSKWGYMIVNYLLSIVFSVQTESTLFDLVIGIIGIIASVLIFIGTIFVWNQEKSKFYYMLSGSLAFILKSCIEGANEVYKLANMAQVTSSEISTASWAIGYIFLQIAFWIFIIKYFGKAKA